MALRGRNPDLPLADEASFILSAPAGDKEIGQLPFKELYLTFRSKVENSRHFEQKWVEALGVDIGDEWKEVWRRVHGSNCSLRVRSHIWRQLNLNFWTTYMDFAYIARGDGDCLLCGQRARERWHVVVECGVVVELWRKLGEVVGVWGGPAVGRLEMALGRAGTDQGTVVRNRLGFTLRSAVHRMRGMRVGGFEETVGRLWSIFLRSLRRELEEEWCVARMEGSVTLFASRVLVGGVLGSMEEGEVTWGPLFDGVGYRYWDLFG